MLVFKRFTDHLKRNDYSRTDFQKIRQSCVASTLGKANRVVGRIYEEAFRDVGISSPQFALLVALMISPDSTAGELAESLSADPSTVSRNTEVLLKRGLVSTCSSPRDRRVRIYCLTPEGQQTVQACVPRWKRAQRTALRKIGRSAWHDARRVLRRLFF